MSPFDGVLVIDKPAGPTSHDVVARARRVLGERRIGHTGTLDPMATGVLPLVIGRATRLARFLSGARKRYDAGIVLGLETDTCDAHGTVTGGTRADDPAARLPGPVEVEGALQRFRGTFLQHPPAFSAKKVAGVSAHRLARRGGTPRLQPAEVTVHDLRLAWIREGEVSLALEVSAGFYVRSLAQDLGRVLGCGAHLSALRRTAAGEYDLAAALALDLLDETTARARLLALDTLMPWAPAVRLTAEGEIRARHGNLIDSGHVTADERSARGRAGGVVRLMGRDDRLVAVSVGDDGAGGWPLHPSVVLA